MKKSILVAVLFIYTALYADDRCTVSSNKLIKELISTHPTIKMTQEAQKGAKARVDSAKWNYYPTPSVDISAKNKDEKTAFARLEQPIWTGGKIDSMVDIAKSEEKEILYESLESSYRLIDYILNILLSYKQSKANIYDLKLALNTLKELDLMLDRRVEAGISAKADKELLNSRIEQINVDIINAQNRFDVSKMQLELLLDRDLMCDVVLDEIKLKKSNNLEESIKSLLEFHPSIKKVQAKLESSKAELKSTKSSIMPNLVLRAEHQRGSMDRDIKREHQNIIYANLSMTTNAGFSAKSNIESAKMKINQISFEKLSIEKELIDSLLGDFNSYLVTNNKINSLKSSISSAQNVLDSYKRLFVVGKKQWLDLVNSQRELMQYSVELSNQRVLKLILEYKLALKNGQIDLESGEID